MKHNSEHCFSAIKLLFCTEIFCNIMLNSKSTVWCKIQRFILFLSVPYVAAGKVLVFLLLQEQNRAQHFDHFYNGLALMCFVSIHYILTWQRKAETKLPFLIQLVVALHRGSLSCHVSTSQPSQHIRK